VEVDRALEAVRQEGGRLTATRRIVLEALTALTVEAGAAGPSTGPSPSPGTGPGTGATAEQLAEVIRAEHPSFSDSTVYRSLERFEKLGLVTHAHLGHGPALWRLADQPRWYVVCSACEAAVQVEPDVIRPLLSELMRRVGFSMDGHFAITGLCQRCSARER
jgi:Fur family ferric uptake transcriptional regulator